jgi:hypothetical protein
MWCYATRGCVHVREGVEGEELFGGLEGYLGGDGGRDLGNEVRSVSVCWEEGQGEGVER